MEYKAHQGVCTVEAPWGAYAKQKQTKKRKDKKKVDTAQLFILLPRMNSANL